MPKLYNFMRLIKKYSTSFTFLMPKAGSYVGGKFIESEAEEIAALGAIIPMPESKIYVSGGTYTSKDKQLYMLQPLTKALQGAKIKYKNNIYSIEQETEYTEYCDVAVYNLKWVSRFD